MTSLVFGDLILESLTPSVNAPIVYTSVGWEMTKKHLTLVYTMYENFEGPITRLVHPSIRREALLKKF
jgi:hypothetical protein